MVVVGARVGLHTCGMFRGGGGKKNGERDVCTDRHDVFSSRSGHIVNSISHPINPAGGKTQHKIYGCLMIPG